LDEDADSFLEDLDLGSLLELAAVPEELGVVDDGADADDDDGATCKLGSIG